MQITCSLVVLLIFLILTRNLYRLILQLCMYLGCDELEFVSHVECHVGTGQLLFGPLCFSFLQSEVLNNFEISSLLYVEPRMTITLRIAMHKSFYAYVDQVGMKEKLTREDKIAQFSHTFCIKMFRKASFRISISGPFGIIRDYSGL